MSQTISSIRERMSTETTATYNAAAVKRTMIESDWSALMTPTSPADYSSEAEVRETIAALPAEWEVTPDQAEAAVTYWARWHELDALNS